MPHNTAYEQITSFPMPDNALALFDIDKTLIDVQYNVTDTGIYPAVELAQNDGWTVGLSSDTPHARMANRRVQFGTNGPIIAERGAVVEWGGKLHYDNEVSDAFGVTLDSAECGLLESGLRVVRSYPDEFRSVRAEPGKPGEAVILINPLRLCSVGLWARRFDKNGRLAIDNELTSHMAELVRPHLPDIDIFWDLNHEYGILIAAPNAMSKRVGTQKFMEFAGVSGRVAMVGDSMSDFVGHDIARHYAVGNASPDFKDRADYVASASITVGSIEILEGLRNGQL
ncbi:MAG TPA: hypothetical protein VMR45_00805 [Patescibacteria group bacterium]|nr:hypothetical protein [Patescibacteria group bacterium]